MIPKGELSMKYVQPTVELLYLATADVLTTSDPTVDDGFNDETKAEG